MSVDTQAATDRLMRFLAVEGDYITGQAINVNGGIYM